MYPDKELSEISKTKLLFLKVLICGLTLYIFWFDPPERAVIDLYVGLYAVTST